MKSNFESGGVAVMEPPKRRTTRRAKPQTNLAEDFAAAARRAIENNLSADSATFLQATRQTSAE